MNQFKQNFTFGILAATVFLSACSDSGSDTPPLAAAEDNEIPTVIVNASSQTDYVYYNLERGEAVTLTEEQAAASTDWHVAFRRSTIKLNGGTSGPGNVAAALAAAQDDFYNEDEPVNSVFLNATPASELEHLEDEYDLTALDFISDAHVASIQGSGEMIGALMDLGWYNYNPTTHALSANTDNHWLLRSAEGSSYGRFHATALTYGRTTGLDVTFDFDVQATGTSQFVGTATFNAHIDAAGGSDCFDFDTDSTVACDTANWDLKLEVVGRDWNMWVNGGVSGSGRGVAFGPLEADDANAYVSATIEPNSSTNISSHYITDLSAGIFTEHSWYGYNLQNDHKLWPNYRTYVIDTDTTDATAPKFALQIVNYYSDTGVGGYPNIRFVEVE